MIITRLARSIRNQNWSQIITEILIVVIGIFLGLQVQAFYDDRQNVEQEKDILLSLSTEVDELLVEKIRDIERSQADNKILLQSLDILYGDNQNADFSEEMCQSLGRSVIIFWSYRPLISAEEIIASGRLNLIQSEELRQIIMNYKTSLEELAYSNNNSRDNLVSIYRNFPELISRRFVTPNSPADCDVEKIRSNIQFRADIQTNTQRKNDVYQKSVRELEQLQEIKSLLDHELALKNEGAVS
jgi:hypothetical protein